MNAGEFIGFVLFLPTMGRQDAQKEDDQLGLTAGEQSFYDALTKPQAIKDFYQQLNTPRIQRLLPKRRQKSFACKMKMEAMSRQGKRNDLTSDQVGPKLTADEIGQGDSNSVTNQR